jgi:hypothetical protein
MKHSTHMLRAIKIIRDLVEGEGKPWREACTIALLRTQHVTLGLNEQAQLLREAEAKYGAAQ